MSEQILEQTDAAKKLAVAIYLTHGEAEAAIRKLEKSGFNMKTLSIIGKDYHTDEHVVGYYSTGDRMMAWGGLGAFWGGLWGILFGSAVFLIPDIGPVLMAGPFVAALVGGLEGAAVVGGVSALSAALISIGIPRNSAISYETELAAGRFVLIVHGTHEETARARTILQLTNEQSV